jgi:hypothetical protein
MKIKNGIVVISGSSFIAQETIRVLKRRNTLNIISKKRIKPLVSLNSSHKFFYDKCKYEW